MITIIDRTYFIKDSKCKNFLSKMQGIAEGIEGEGGNEGENEGEGDGEEAEGKGSPTEGNLDKNGKQDKSPNDKNQEGEGNESTKDKIQPGEDDYQEGEGAGVLPEDRDGINQIKKDEASRISVKNKERWKY